MCTLALVLKVKDHKIPFNQTCRYNIKNLKTHILAYLGNNILNQINTNNYRDT